MRQKKFQELSIHAHYGRLFKRLNESELEEVVSFIEDFGQLDDWQFERKVLRFGLDLQNKPKNVNVMADLLLACKRSAK